MSYSNRFARTAALLPALLLFLAGAAHPLRAAGENINVTIANLPPGKTVRIQYTTTVEASLPSGNSTISNQGTVTFAGGGTILTDDAAGGGGSADPTTTPAYNPAPSAGADTIARYPSQSVKVTVVELLANDTDPGGNTPLTITAVSHAGGNGAVVTLVGDTVFYHPNGHTGPDSFTYTLQNSVAATATGTVSVLPVTDGDPTGSQTLFEILPDGSASVAFAGIPGRAYRIEASATLAPASWTTIGNVTADAQGRIAFTDPPPLPPVRFYRTVSP